MNRAHVVYQIRREGGGTVWVRRRRGGWRAITFESGGTQVAKLLGLAGVLDRLGSATTTLVRGVLLIAQSAACAVAGTPKTPRAGPVTAAVQPCGP